MSHATTNAAGTELHGELVTEPGRIRKQEPRLFRRRLRGSRRHRFWFDPCLARQEANEAFAALRADQSRQGRRLAEARIAQHFFPLRPLEQWMVGTQIAIGETPPAAGQTKDRVQPQM